MATELTVRPMDKKAASKIVCWRYQQPYDLYNLEVSDEAISGMLNGSYFQVEDRCEVQDIVGFCCFGEDAQVPSGRSYEAYPSDGSLDVGLGLHPDLTGVGNGGTFLQTILMFGEAYFHVKRFRLTVATFNTRAIRLYQTCGFVPGITFPRGDVVFLVMCRA